jgi:elongation factor 1-alpha
MFQIKTIEDVPTALQKVNTIIPYIYTSNKDGTGLDLLRALLRLMPKRKQTLINGFAVEHIYNVTGHGTVVSGMVGQSVSKGDTLYIGPFGKGEFTSVKVKSLHNDYRYDVDSLSVGKKGCLCIAIDARNKKLLRKGMVLTKELPKNICRSFTAKVRIFHHHTSIKAGYNAAANCGVIREPVIFRKLVNSNGEDVNIIRSGDEVIAHLEFACNLNCVEPGQTFVFREGTTRGIGTIIGTDPLVPE